MGRVTALQEKKRDLNILFDSRFFVYLIIERARVRISGGVVENLLEDIIIIITVFGDDRLRAVCCELRRGKCII